MSVEATERVICERFMAGEVIAALVMDYGMEIHTIEDVLRRGLTVRHAPITINMRCTHSDATTIIQQVDEAMRRTLRQTQCSNKQVWRD